MTHSFVWHDSFICVTWLIHMCDMTHSYVWHDSFICVTWLIHMCDMTHSYVWHDSFTCYVPAWQNSLTSTSKDLCVLSYIRICDLLHVWIYKAHTNSYNVVSFMDVCDAYIQIFVYVTCYECMQDTAGHCNTLQHTATHCNTLQLRASCMLWMHKAHIDLVTYIH